MAAENENQSPDNPVEADETNAWVKPEIVSFEPAKAAEGINFKPNDGLSNLT